MAIYIHIGCKNILWAREAIRDACSQLEWSGVIHAVSDVKDVPCTIYIQATAFMSVGSWNDVFVVSSYIHPQIVNRM